MSEYQPCIITELNGLSDETILRQYGDSFTANALWCGRAACTLFKAYTATGDIDNRGTCATSKVEFAEQTVGTDIEPTSNERIPTQQPESSLLDIPTDPHASIHTLARQAVASSISFGAENLGADLIGQKSNRAVRGPRWLGWS